MAVDDKRILIIARCGAPPPNFGNRVRMVALLRELRRMGYVVHFAGVRMDATEKATTRPWVDEWVWDFVDTPRPVGLARFRDGLVYRGRRWLRRFLVMQDRVDDMYQDQWLAEARNLQQQRRYTRVMIAYVYHSKFLLAFPDPCLKILDTHDAFSDRGRRLHADKEDLKRHNYTREDEKRGLLRAQRIIAIQQQEAVYFTQLLGGRATVQVVGHLAEVPEDIPPAATVSRLGYLGSRKNKNNLDGTQWFLREVWSGVRARIPDAELWLAGEIGDQAESDAGVRAVGPVSSMGDFGRNCSVFINPMLKGTGLKIKTIEALMQGRPVVTTSVGAEGLESFFGHGLFACDSPEAFGNAVVDLLSDLPKSRELGEQALQEARNYVAENRQSFQKVLAE